MIHFSPHGQGLLEYALLIILVGMAVLIALAIFGTSVGNLFSNIVSNF
jgi:Flp pilus assembly pilin Flp